MKEDSAKYSFPGQECLFKISRTVILLIIFIFPSFISCHRKVVPESRAVGSSIREEDGSGAYATGRYRNLFLENGHSREEILKKNQVVFQQLFHGDSATQAVVFKAGSNNNGPMAYVCDVLHNDVRSEGISYGMMIAVQMDKKAE
ncbi:MAG: glycoside hydrolase, partial [Bacteroidetes bacterium]|nr:glycoside hydrolase [Bacteroidota bacterium]